jgi:hypothetical protein
MPSPSACTQSDRRSRYSFHRMPVRRCFDTDICSVFAARCPLPPFSVAVGPSAMHTYVDHGDRLCPPSPSALLHHPACHPQFQQRRHRFILNNLALHHLSTKLISIRALTMDDFFGNKAALAANNNVNDNDFGRRRRWNPGRW